MNSHARQLGNFYQLSFPEFDVKLMSSKKLNPFKDFQSDQIQRNSRKIFTAHYACTNAALNLTSVTGTSNGFIFQIINSLLECWGVGLTCLDCKIIFLSSDDHIIEQ